MSDDKNQNTKGNDRVISLEERRGAHAARPRAKEPKVTPTLMRKKTKNNQKPPKSSSIGFQLARAFQMVAVIFAGYLVLRSCGLAK